MSNEQKTIELTRYIKPLHLSRLVCNSISTLRRTDVLMNLRHPNRPECLIISPCLSNIRQLGINSGTPKQRRAVIMTCHCQAELMLLLNCVNETEIVGTCPDMAIQPYTALYSSIKGNDFADVLDIVSH